VYVCMGEGGGELGYDMRHFVGASEWEISTGFRKLRALCALCGNM
jgi:hypothetical protein